MKRILILLLIATSSVFSQEFKEELLVHQNDTLPYRILIPDNYNSQSPFPLLLFLHGAGERGSDNKSQLVHGSFLFKSEDFRNNYPTIVVFPQCPEKSSWANVKRNYDMLNGKKFDFFKEI